MAEGGRQRQGSEKVEAGSDDGIDQKGGEEDEIDEFLDPRPEMVQPHPTPKRRPQENEAKSGIRARRYPWPFQAGWGHWGLSSPPRVSIRLQQREQIRLISSSSQDLTDDQIVSLIEPKRIVAARPRESPRF